MKLRNVLSSCTENFAYRLCSKELIDFLVVVKKVSEKDHGGNNTALRGFSSIRKCSDWFWRSGPECDLRQARRNRSSSSMTVGCERWTKKFFSKNLRALTRQLRGMISTRTLP